MKKITLILLFILFSTLLFGCAKGTIPEKSDYVDYTVVNGTKIPKELQKLIQKRKRNNFCLSYNDGQYLYVVKGYGKQPTSGYSIAVQGFYYAKKDNSLVFDTELFGPKQGESISEQPTYPYIVIKTENQDLPIIFLCFSQHFSIARMIKSN